MKIQYIANDGKIFDNEIDCREYESKKQVDEFINKRELIFLSRSGRFFSERLTIAPRELLIFLLIARRRFKLFGEKTNASEKSALPKKDTGIMIMSMKLGEA